jgi:transglutaminase-like putative cysteine protease
MYEYVVDTMTYDKTGDSWGEGGAIFACTNKRGNCMNFHSLFVGMARNQKIPARFEIGLPIPPSGSVKIPGYHCWARAYSNTDDWFPFDASESKKPGRNINTLAGCRLIASISLPTGILN